MVSENQTLAQNEIEPQPQGNRTAASILSGLAPTMRLRARHTDGSHEVVVRGDRHLELVLPDTDPVVFSSKRQLLLALTGHDRHWTFERYFRIGRHAPAAPRSEPAFDLLIEFGEAPSPCTSSTTKSGIVTVKRGGTGKPSALYEAKGSQALVTVSPDTVDAMTCALAVVEGVDDGSGLGIDLVNRSHEVAKLLFAGFGQWIFSANYDPDDVLQEVYKGLLARNRGKCPWDVKKSSFGHYVHMVCRGVLSNYHRKMKRRKEFETTGISGFGDDGQWGKMDAGGTCVVAAKPSDAAEASGLSEAQVALTVFLEGSEKSHTQDGKMAVKVLPMVSIGMTRAEIAEKLGVSRASVSRGLTYLREQSKLWQGASA